MTDCDKCSERAVVSYRGEMLCGPCFLAASAGLPPPHQLPRRALILMNELMALLRTADRKEPVAVDAATAGEER